MYYIQEQHIENMLYDVTLNSNSKYQIRKMNEKMKNKTKSAIFDSDITFTSRFLLQ